MTQPLVFAKKNLLELNDNKLTDHNRSELNVTNEPIEVSKRMVDGTLRRWVVAVKKKFSVSWDDVPHHQDFTVDGYWGGTELHDFYKTNTGPLNDGVVTLKINNGDGSSESFFVVMTSFSHIVKKRGSYELWNMSLELEEV